MESSSQIEASNLKCVIPGCQWICQFSFESHPQESLRLVELHMVHAHRQQEASTAKARTKFVPPSIDIGVDQETWVAFTIRWEQYCKGSGIPQDLQSLQLFQCASETLGNLLLRTNPKITNCSAEVVLEELQRLAVIPTAKGVARADLMKMVQASDERFRRFASRVQGKASICGFSVKHRCECGKDADVDYTCEVIKDVILAGISDEAVRTCVLETDDIEDRSLNEIVAFVERKEEARKKVHIQSSVSAVSSFKRQSSQVPSHRQQPQESPKIPCPICKKSFRKFNGRNSKAYECCLNCFRNSRSKPRNRSQGAAAITADDEQDVALLQDYNNDSEPGQGNTNYINVLGQRSHHTRDQPRVAVRLCPVGSSTFITISGIADTGAQSNIWGINEFLNAGLDERILQKVPLNICAANKEPLQIAGGFLATLEGESPEKEKVSCQAMIYVSKSVTGFFVSFDTLIKLKVVNSDFPIIGASLPKEINSISSVDILAINSGCPSVNPKEIHCDCPQRSSVPVRPIVLPFSPTPENIGRMKQWLLDYFKSSTFNTCPHQPLQQMSGPPIEIHISDSAVPKVCNKPSSIPLHWLQKVYEDILRDEALGILERVPYGVPVIWCHRLVVTRKHDGTPRRTVDLSPLNKYCKRETHSAESPYHLARRIPSNSWKTVTDAWNGYHSVPLRESDRHLTTFITPFGRWRYTRAPQGYLSSGDGYNRRRGVPKEGAMCR